MKKGQWNSFVDGISNSDMMKILVEYEQLEEDGSIGECFLRDKAEEWERIAEYPNVVLIMRDLAFAAYKRFAEYYLKDNGDGNGDRRALRE